MEIKIAMDLTGRDFLTLKDYTPDEIEFLINLAGELKEKKKKGVVEQPLIGKNVALIFEKTSTRTRCSFEVAAHDLGIGTTYLDPKGSQIGKKESIADTARVLAGMYDGIEYRGFGQEIVEELAKHSKVPVWNGLTNEYHPTQMLADMLTIREKLGHLKGVKFVYMGDARYNMGNSLMIVCAKLGLHFTACTTKEYFPNDELVAQCKEWAKASGGSVTLCEDVKEATKDADVIYTDVWGVVGAAIYGSTMVVLYAMSSIYHGLKPEMPKKVFQVIDHCTIYFLIAGTYTPVTLTALRPQYPVQAFVIFGIVWACCFIAATLTAIDLKKYQILSMICYLAMGWCIIFFIKPTVQCLGTGGTVFLFTGGVAYTIGAILYGIGKKKKYVHSIFHLFVVAGSILHFFMILFYVIL